MRPPPPKSGVHAALWTPTDAHGRLLKRPLASHLKFLRQHGVHGVLALGSTGEFPRFSVDERKAVLDAVCEEAAPLSVVANISDLRPAAAIELGKHARKMGLPAVALMPPSFFPVSPADMLEFFLRVAENVKLPVFLYNFPELTGNRIGIDTVAAFADRAAMAGIKQSGGEFDYNKALVELGREKNFVVLSGADTRLPEVFALGGAGCIGGLVNIVPELMVHIYRVCKGEIAGDYTVAAAHMIDVARVIDRLTFPLNVAAAMEARGFDAGSPKTCVSAQSTRLYRSIVADLRRMFREWRLTPGPDPRRKPSV